MDKRIIQKSQKDFSEAEKHHIIRELISTQCTKVERQKPTIAKSCTHSTTQKNTPKKMPEAT